MRSWMEMTMAMRLYMAWRFLDYDGSVYSWTSTPNTQLFTSLSILVSTFSNLLIPSGKSFSFSHAKQSLKH